MRGWVSLPVLLIIAAITWQLHHQSQSLTRESIWLKQRQLDGGNSQWHEVLQALESRLSMGQANMSACVDFCPLNESSWQSLDLNQQTTVFYQAHQHPKLPVERWCASLDRVTARCWWRQQQRTSWSHLSVI